LTALQGGDFDAALIDLNYARDTTSGQEGLGLLARIQTQDSTLPVVVMTAWANVELAVEAMRAGAYDYLKKPFDFDELEVVVGKALETTAAATRGRRDQAGT
jgi:DNA-binding NtrC family response regulator